MAYLYTYPDINPDKLMLYTYPDIDPEKLSVVVLGMMSELFMLMERQILEECCYGETPKEALRLQLDIAMLSVVLNIRGGAPRTDKYDYTTYFKYVINYSD